MSDQRNRFNGGGYMQKWGQETRLRGKSKREEYVPELKKIPVLGVQMQSWI